MIEQDFGKINFDMVLMIHIQDTCKQLSKLPHEGIMPAINNPVGTTQQDIRNSYCDMVAQLGALLSPYWDDEFINAKKDTDTFKNAIEYFSLCMKLCGRKSFLFTKIRTKVSAEDSE